MVVKGTYHYKCVSNGKEWTATAFGDMAEDMPECSAPDMYTLEKAMMDATAAKSGEATVTFQNTMITKTVSLWTSNIGMATAVHVSVRYFSWQVSQRRRCLSLTTFDTFYERPFMSDLL